MLHTHNTHGLHTDTHNTHTHACIHIDIHIQTHTHTPIQTHTQSLTSSSQKDLIICRALAVILGASSTNLENSLTPQHINIHKLAHITTNRSRGSSVAFAPSSKEVKQRSYWSPSVSLAYSWYSQLTARS